MQDLIYPKDIILKTLRENLETHVDKVSIAQKKYQKAITDELKARLEDAKAGKPIDQGFLHLLPVPQNYTSYYERAIKQLELCKDTELTLSDSEFKQFIMDEWGWSQQFTSSNSPYLAGTKYENG